MWGENSLKMELGSRDYGGGEEEEDEDRERERESE